MFAIKTEMHYQAVRCMMWNTSVCARCHHPTDNKVSKCWGQQWRQGKRRPIKSDTPFLGFANPFFSQKQRGMWSTPKASDQRRRKVLFVSAWHQKWESSFKSSAKARGIRPQILRFCHLQISAPTSALFSPSSSFLIPQSRYLDLVNPIVVWVQNRDGKKKQKTKN